MNIDGLLVGLGNPGPQYASTRHNFGFLTVDAFLAHTAAQPGGQVEELGAGKGKYQLFRCRLRASNWLAVKPQTFMNRSGDAVVHVLGFYKIPMDKLIVAHDELDLALGRVQLKPGGGAAGHNGIRSIIERTGTADFLRIRLGIGKPAGFDTTSFVLGAFNAEELKTVEAVSIHVAKLLPHFPALGLERLRTSMNSFRMPLAEADTRG